MSALVSMQNIHDSPLFASLRSFVYRLHLAFARVITMQIVGVQDLMKGLGVKYLKQKYQMVFDKFIERKILHEDTPFSDVDTTLSHTVCTLALLVLCSLVRPKSVQRKLNCQS
jgi:hypothetical protein